MKHKFVGAWMVINDKTKLIKVRKACMVVCVHDE